MNLWYGIYEPVLQYTARHRTKNDLFSTESLKNKVSILNYFVKIT